MIHKDFVVDRPEKTKIQNGYVFLVIGSKSRNRGDRWVTTEDRVCIGKLTDEDKSKMYPNDNYFEHFNFSPVKEPRMYNDTLKVGSTAVIDNITSYLGIKEILSNIYSEEEVSFILDILVYFILGRTGVMQHYGSFMRDRLSFDRTIKSDTSISNLLAREITDESIFSFQDQWTRRFNNREAIAISYDSTSYNSVMEDSSYAEYGRPKVDEGLPQVNLSYCVDMDSKLPLFFEQYLGSINDMSQCKYMIQKAKGYGFNNIRALSLILWD